MDKENQLSILRMYDRLALDDDVLVAHRFKSGALRMVSRDGFDRWSTSSEARPQTLKEMFTMFFGFAERPLEDEPKPVVGIPPEALVRFVEIPAEWQARYSLAPSDEALFVSPGAFYFGNGIAIPLEALPEGQNVIVLHRSWPDVLETLPQPAHARR